MPKVPPPTDEQIRELLQPVAQWSRAKSNAEQGYREAILAAYRAVLPVVHIARYTGTSPQAVKKIIDRSASKTQTSSRHGDASDSVSTAQERAS